MAEQEIAPGVAGSASRLRITYILEATTGGTRRHLFDLATHLDPARFAVSILCATRRDPAFAADLEVFRERGMPTRIVPMVRAIRPWADLAALRQIRRYLQEQRPDVVHTHSSKAGFLGRLAARQAGVPRVVHTPHCFAFDMDVGFLRRSLYLRLERWAASLTDRIICVCPAEKASALRQRVAPPEKFTVIENGISLPASVADPAAVASLRRDLGLPAEAPIIGVVGRLTRQKGHEYLIRAAPAILRHFPQARLVFVGDGELRPALAKQAAALGVAHSIVFAGQCEDAGRYYPLFDVLAMPSLWEALPYALLDAMAAGMALVASRVGGMPDLITAGESGLLVPPGAPAALAENLCAALAAPELRARLGVNARKVVAQRCRLDEMVARTAAVYSACGALASPRSPPGEESRGRRCPMWTLCAPPAPPASVRWTPSLGLRTAQALHALRSWQTQCRLRSPQTGRSDEVALQGRSRGGWQDAIPRRKQPQDYHRTISMRKVLTGIALAAATLVFAAASARAGGTVCFEAESAKTLTPPMRVVDAAKPPPGAKTAPVKGASGGKYIEIPEGAGKPPEVGGDATYSFEISEAGTYYLWCRVWWPDGCGNSFGMSIDGAAAFTFGQDATYKSWHWFRAPLKLKQLELAKGTHTLVVSNREDGAILDQILLVTEKRYVPVDIETVTPAAGR